MEDARLAVAGSLHYPPRRRARAFLGLLRYRSLHLGSDGIGGDKQGKFLIYAAGLLYAAITGVQYFSEEWFASAAQSLQVLCGLEGLRRLGLMEFEFENSYKPFSGADLRVKVYPEDAPNPDVEKFFFGGPSL